MYWKNLLMLWACGSLLGIMQGFYIQQDNRWPWPNTFQKANIVIFIWFIMISEVIRLCLVRWHIYHIVNNPTISWYPINLYQNTLLYQSFCSQNSWYFYVLLDKPRPIPACARTRNIKLVVQRKRLCVRSFSV